MIKVLVVDDSPLVCRLLGEILGQEPDIQVVGSASDPMEAREMIKRLRPDVLTLDVEMPKMDGITFLENLMRLRPMPVVMISALTLAGAETTLRALELGAVDFIAKPRLDISQGLREYSREIVEKVRLASRARVHPLERRIITPPPPVSVPATKTGAARLIAIGASTGGTEAIREILQELPEGLPGIVITQHIPASFSKPFAERLNGASRINVYHAEDRQPIEPGCAYVAPGDRHLKVERAGTGYRCRLDDGDPVNRHKPSVDVLFDSVAQSAGGAAMGIILTGMGADGAEGMGRMMSRGAFTLAQDEQSSVVWGMPGETVKRGYAKEVLSLGKIAARVLSRISQG